MYRSIARADSASSTSFAPASAMRRAAPPLARTQRTASLRLPRSEATGT